MAPNGEHTAAIKEDVRHVRETVSRDNLEERLREVVEDRPAVQEFLEPRPIALALAVAAVLTLIAALLFSLVLAAVVLVVSFFGTWVFLAMRSFEQRRPTRGMDEVSKQRGSDPAPFSG